MKFFAPTFFGIAIFSILWRHNNGMEDIFEGRADFRETIRASNILLNDNTSNYRGPVVIETAWFHKTQGFSKGFLDAFCIVPYTLSFVWQMNKQLIICIIDYKSYLQCESYLGFILVFFGGLQLEIGV